jgi:hypothetical protein
LQARGARYGVPLGKGVPALAVLETAVDDLATPL